MIAGIIMQGARRSSSRASAGEPTVKAHRVLLLTDMPPCDNFPAGIVTAQICRALPREGLSMFCVLNRHLRPAPAPEFEWIPSCTVPKPEEAGRLKVKGIPVPSLVTIGAGLAMRWLKVPALIRRAVRFGRAQNATLVWAMLQGQTMVRMAVPVAARLGIPLIVQVWDPLGWWLKEHRVDRISARLDLEVFDRAMASAAGCASASWKMTEHYKARYGTAGEPVLVAMDRSVAQPILPRLHNEAEVVIGMAGQFYASAEWLTLVQALADADWKVAGRAVRLRVVGNQEPPGAIPPSRLERLGWFPQAEAIRVLSERCDVLYCGYPFAESMQEVSRLSFPSKLPTYFAAGRPVLFHGPADSSPGSYLASRQAASMATELSAKAIYRALSAIIEDPALYERLAVAGRAAFEADFTPEQQVQAVRRMLTLAIRN